MWEVSGSSPVVRVEIGVVTYKDMNPQCGRSVVHVRFIDKLVFIFPLFHQYFIRIRRN